MHTLQGGFSAPCAMQKPGTTPKTRMNTRAADSGESGAKNAKSSEYSSNKLTANGNKRAILTSARDSVPVVERFVPQGELKATSNDYLIGRWLSRTEVYL